MKSNKKFDAQLSKLMDELKNNEELFDGGQGYTDIQGECYTKSYEIGRRLYGLYADLYWWNEGHTILGWPDYNSEE